MMISDCKYHLSRWWDRHHALSAPSLGALGGGRAAWNSMGWNHVLLTRHPVKCWLTVAPHAFPPATCRWGRNLDVWTSSQIYDGESWRMNLGLCRWGRNLDVWILDWILTVQQHGQMYCEPWAKVLWTLMDVHCPAGIDAGQGAGRCESQQSTACRGVDCLRLIGQSCRVRLASIMNILNNMNNYCSLCCRGHMHSLCKRNLATSVAVKSRYFISPTFKIWPRHKVQQHEHIGREARWLHRLSTSTLSHARVKSVLEITLLKFIQDWTSVRDRMLWCCRCWWYMLRAFLMLKLLMWGEFGALVSQFSGASWLVWWCGNSV